MSMPVSVFVRVPVPVLAPADIAKHEVQRPRRSVDVLSVFKGYFVQISCS